MEGEIWGSELPVCSDAAYRQLTLAIVIYYAKYCYICAISTTKITPFGYNVKLLRYNSPNTILSALPATLISFRALTLLAGQQESYPACKVMH